MQLLLLPRAAPWAFTSCPFMAAKYVLVSCQDLHNRGEGRSEGKTASQLWPADLLPPKDKDALGKQRDLSAGEIVSGRHDLQLPLLDRAADDDRGLGQQLRLDPGIGVDGSVEVGARLMWSHRLLRAPADLKPR